ncbi:Pair1 [Thalictrum thalictroides]|uniref:Pair1 n=1 Tax=Thalictrum thalictroides TaxID=46969 RepID=A0A7J6XG32_THATH|nr:Pair1 [Thalictrum thalictroides]
MKLKINQACDLSSISVLPPPSRRTNAIGSGNDSSVFGKSQASQLRSQQQSQQSFSQGMSQLSQNSLDEILPNEPIYSTQRFGSQGDNTTKRTSCLAPVAYNREDTQMPMSRSSNNIVRRWGSASVQDHTQKCQVSEELEHRIGVIETSLNRFGMILDSVQGDVMQVNRAIKEVSMETEGVRKKLASHDSSLQLMLKGEDDIKASLAGSLKCIPDQLRKDLQQYRLKETVSTLLSLPDQIEAQLLKIQSGICSDISKEMGAIMRNIQLPYHKDVSPTLSTQTRSCHIQSPQEKLPVMKNPVVVSNARTRRSPVRKIKAESQDFIIPKRAPLTKRQQTVKHKPDAVSLIEKDIEWRVVIESDEEIDVGFSCLFGEKETGMGGNSFDDVRGDTERILRKARRRKRRYCNPIILD